MEEKIKAPLQTRKAKLLTHAGRDVLIKYTLSSIPIYTLSSFLIPYDLLDKLNKGVRSFWWGHGLKFAPLNSWWTRD